MVQLLRIDSNTLINPAFIVQITLVNLNNLSKERGQNYKTQEQIARLDNKVWEVSVYLRSDNNGYNPQRITERFTTQQEAQKWINEKFGGAIIKKL